VKDHEWEAIGFEIPWDDINNSFSPDIDRNVYTWFKCKGCGIPFLTRTDLPADIPAAPSSWDLELEFLDLDCNKLLCKILLSL